MNPPAAPDEAAAGAAPLVVLERVSRVYPRPERAVHALDDVSLAIGRGEFVAVTGPSGSGKSTLLHLLGLLDTPSAGAYRLGGRDVAGLDDASRATIRNRKIGLVFQAFQLVPHLTVMENVELPLAYRRVARDERATRSRAALARVGLSDRLGHRPDELSGGEQQRVAIARALVGEPDLLLADEPTGNLDEAATRAVLELFAGAHRGGTTVLVVTHNAQVAASAGRTIAMRAGRLVAGDPHDEARP